MFEIDACCTPKVFEVFISREHSAVLGVRSVRKLSNSMAGTFNIRIKITLAKNGSRWLFPNTLFVKRPASLELQRPSNLRRANLCHRVNAVGSPAWMLLSSCLLPSPHGRGDNDPNADQVMRDIARMQKTKGLSSATRFLSIALRQRQALWSFACARYHASPGRHWGHCRLVHVGSATGLTTTASTPGKCARCTRWQRFARREFYRPLQLKRSVVSRIGCLETTAQALLPA